MNRIFTFVMLSMLALAANAARVVDGINYELVRDELAAYVVPFSDGTQYTGDIVIPETITVGDYTFTVVAIDTKAFQGSKITSVSIPNTVILINDRAFEDCPNLTSLVLPNSVKYIARGAFRNCRNVKSLTLPDNDVMVLEYAFYEMKGLTELVIPDKWTEVGYEDCNEIFYGCENLERLVIGKGVKVIREGAFAECTALKEIVCAEDGQLETLEGGAFADCPNIPSMQFLPRTVKTLGYNAIDCSGMTELFIPSSLKSCKGGLGSAKVKSLVMEDSSEPFELDDILKICPEEIYLGRAISTKVLPYVSDGFSNKNSAGNYMKKVVFGPLFKGGTFWKFGWKVEKVYSLAEDPSAIQCVFTDDVYDNATLYVPTGTKEAYKAQDNFKNFFFIEEFNATGITPLHNESRQDDSRYFNLKGQQTTTPSKGIYIRNGRMVLKK